MGSEATRHEQPYTIVDAFTSEIFRGNPAAVVVLSEPLSDETMQLIAREFNLSETAFLHSLPQNDTGPDTLAYTLRWMTPTVEVKLCGHATLASAKSLFLSQDETIKTLVFKTLHSGTLKATKCQDGKIQLEFPAGEIAPVSERVHGDLVLMLKKALGSDVLILQISSGLGISFDDFLLVEIDTNVGLSNLEVNIGALVSDNHKQCTFCSYDRVSGGHTTLDRNHRYF